MANKNLIKTGEKNTSVTREAIREAVSTILEGVKHNGVKGSPGNNIGTTHPKTTKGNKPH